jgi:hypothetical protein
MSKTAAGLRLRALLAAIDLARLAPPTTIAGRDRHQKTIYAAGWRLIHRNSWLTEPNDLARAAVLVQTGCDSETDKPK